MDYPFGRESTSPSQDTFRLKFTGHERDTDFSGNLDYLDYMHARFYSPVMGRFLSVDPFQTAEALRVPQLWNRYTYVGDDPMNFTDPTGMWRFGGYRGGTPMWKDAISVTGDGSPRNEWLSPMPDWWEAYELRQKALQLDSNARQMHSDYRRATAFGAMAFVDGVNLFGNPLQQYYDDGSIVGLEYSHTIGEFTRNVEIALLSTGSTTLFGRGAWINRNPLGAGRLRVGHSKHENLVRFSVRGTWIDKVAGRAGAHWDWWKGVR